MRVLLVPFFFPPAGGAAVQRVLKFAEHLPALGIETHVLAPRDPKSVLVDDELKPPAAARVHRAPYVGPRGRQPAEELHGLEGFARWAKRAELFPRRLLVPDESVPWAVTATPIAIRLVRAHRIDAVLTTSPPTSVHLVGAAVAAATEVPWIADVRDSLIANPHREIGSHAARLKEQGHRLVAELVARRADAVAAASEVIAAEFAASARGRVCTIRNGCDFEDFEGIDYVSGDRFRITHAGTFFGQRSPRPFLTALARSGLDVVARFVGTVRAVDREWAAGAALGDRLELHPFLSRHRTLAMIRDSEVLLLLMPSRGAASRVIPAKLFDYLAAERPILAAVPPDSAAADLVRETSAGVVVPPDDVDALAAALVDLESRWRAGRLEVAPLAEDVRRALSRRTRAEELAALLRTVAQ